MASIAVRITADIDALNRAFREAQGDAESFKQKLSQVGSVSSAALDRSTQATQGFARAAQRASRDVTDWASIMGGLSPQLQQASVTTLQLTNAVAEFGTKAGLVTGGIALLVAGIFKLVQMYNEATSAAEKFAAAMAKGDPTPQLKRMEELTDLMRRRRAILSELPEAERESVEELNRSTQIQVLGEFRLSEVIKQRGEVQAALHEINKKNYAEENRLVKALADLEAARLRGLAGPIGAEGRKAIEAEGAMAEGAADVFIGLEAAKTLARSDAAQKQLDINAALYGELQRMAIEAEGVITAEQGATVAAAVQGWEDMKQKANETWTSIRSSFASTVAGVVQGTATMAQFFVSALNTMIQATVQWLLDWFTKWGLATAFQTEQESAQVAVHTATETAKTAVTAAEETARTGIVLAASKVALGGAAASVVAIGATGEAAMAVMAAVVAATAAVLAAMGTALAASIVGSPLAPPFFAAAAAVAAVGGAAVAASTAAIAAAIGIASGAIGAALAAPLASGGIVTGPTFAMLGEAGKEAVIPLDRAGGMFSGDLVLSIELDGRTIGNAVFPLLPGYVRMRSGFRTG